MMGSAGATVTASARCPTSMSQRATTQEATSFNLPSLRFIDVSRSDAPRASAHHVSDVRGTQRSSPKLRRPAPHLEVFPPRSYRLLGVELGLPAGASPG